MFNRCPGQEQVKVELHNCPKCGAEVEIFSFEVRVKCYQCGEMVYKENIPTCIEWCAAARQCLGEEKWRQFQESKKQEQERLEESREGDGA